MNISLDVRPADPLLSQHERCSLTAAQLRRVGTGAARIELDSRDLLGDLQSRRHIAAELDGVCG